MAATSTIEVNRVVIEKGLDRQVVLYWYQSHGRVVASEYWGKIYTVVDAIRLNRTDAALVRVIVRACDRTEEATRGRASGGRRVRAGAVSACFETICRHEADTVRSAFTRTRRPALHESHVNEPYAARCRSRADALAAAACAKDPEFAKQEYLKSGDRYVAEQKYSEAVVQYRNAIQQDARFGEARLKLAQTYVKLNDPRNAFREYIRAADLLPDNVDAQVKAATLLLLARQFEDAKTRAEKALAKDPKNVDAQIILGQRAGRPEEPRGRRQGARGGGPARPELGRGLRLAWRRCRPRAAASRRPRRRSGRPSRPTRSLAAAHLALANFSGRPVAPRRPSRRCSKRAGAGPEELAGTIVRWRRSTSAPAGPQRPSRT